jgi:O-methyltransferase
MSEKDGVKSNQGAGDKKFADVDFTEIKSYFTDFPNVIFKRGFFPDTAEGLESQKFCFVYLDADLYQSTKDGLDFFYPRMVPGGIIMFDDYGTSNWPGVEKAVREFCSENDIFPVKMAWWQGLIIKGNKQ